jgi:hypothetical protein
MESERRIEQWSTQWMIVAGRAVCTGCIESQALEDSERQFAHASDCKAEPPEVGPWAALHDILDAARG